MKTLATLILLFILASAQLACTEKPVEPTQPPLTQEALDERSQKQDMVRSRLRFKEGQDRLQNGELSVAQLAFEQSQKLDPTFAESFRMLATVYRKQKDTRACEQMTQYFDLVNRHDEMRTATLKVFCKDSP